MIFQKFKFKQTRLNNGCFTVPGRDVTTFKNFYDNTKLFKSCGLSDDIAWEFFQGYIQSGGSRDNRLITHVMINHELNVTNCPFKHMVEFLRLAYHLGK